RLGDRIVVARHRMDQGQERGRGGRHQEQPDCRGAQLAPRQDPLLGAGGGRDQERDRGLQEEASRARRACFGRRSQRGRHPADRVMEASTQTEPTRSIESTEIAPSKRTISISDKAVEYAKKKLATRGTPDAAIRLGIKGGG